MSRAKKASKPKNRACAVPLLGAAGLSLSMMSGAPAATIGPTAHEITLGEEEISDVSLATFYVFDKENVGTSPSDVQLVGRRGCGGCHHARGCHRGCGGCRGCRVIEAAEGAEAAEAAEVALEFGGGVAAAAAVWELVSDGAIDYS